MSPKSKPEKLTKQSVQTRLHDIATNMLDIEKRLKKGELGIDSEIETSDLFDEMDELMIQYGKICSEVEDLSSEQEEAADAKDDEEEEGEGAETSQEDADEAKADQKEEE